MNINQFFEVKNIINLTGFSGLVYGGIHGILAQFDVVELNPAATLGATGGLIWVVVKGYIEIRKQNILDKRAAQEQQIRQFKINEMESESRKFQDSLILHQITTKLDREQYAKYYEEYEASRKKMLELLAEQEVINQNKNKQLNP